MSCVVAKTAPNSFETVCLSKYGLLGIKIPTKARVDIGGKHLCLFTSIYMQITRHCLSFWIYICFRFYSPQTKLRKGNVFTHVCLFTVCLFAACTWIGGVFQHAPGQGGRVQVPIQDLVKGVPQLPRLKAAEQTHVSEVSYLWPAFSHILETPFLSFLTSTSRPKTYNFH